MVDTLLDLRSELSSLARRAVDEEAARTVRRPDLRFDRVSTIHGSRGCGTRERGEEDHPGDEHATHRARLSGTVDTIASVRIKVIADVHGDLQTVLDEAAACDVLLLLGDLINVIDYSNAGGILAEVYGSDAVRKWSALRAEGKFDESRAVLREISAGREEELRGLFFKKIDQETEEFCTQIPDNVIVTYGNVDVPDLIRKYIPDGVRFVDAEVLTIDGTRFGFVGGGLPKVGIPGEVALDAYQEKVSALGPVDVLCAHVPPAVEDLTYDVVADFYEPGSEALSAYIDEHGPAWMYYGHVHQPKVGDAQVGATHVVNVGSYYRSTGKAWEHTS
jgi:Icc-related predicted phosphoesterase